MSGPAPELYASNNMRTIYNNRGISLIELVIAIIVIGLAIPALTRNWFDITQRSIRSEEIFDSASYNEQLMEEIKSKRFDESTEPPWTPENSLGVESDEDTRAKYDDIDDYDGFGETLPGGFQSSVQVAYVDLSGTVWQAVTGQETDFKRVNVTVSRTNGGSSTTLVAVKGRY